MKGLTIWFVLLLLARQNAQTAPSGPPPSTQSIGTPDVLLTTSEGQTATPLSVDFNYFGNRLMALTNNSIVVWQRNQQNGAVNYRRSHSISLTTPPTVAAIAPSGTVIVSAGNNTNVTIWRENQNGQFVEDRSFGLQGARTNQRITTMKFDITGTSLFVGTTIGHIYWYNFTNNQPQFKQKMLHGLGSIVDLTAGTTRMVSSGTDGTSVVLWFISPSMGTFIQDQRINAPGGFPVRAVELSQDETLLALGQSNGNIAIYTRPPSSRSLSSLQNITGAHSGQVNDIAFANDGLKMVSTGGGGTIFWQRPVVLNTNTSFIERRRTTDVGSSTTYDRRHRVAVGLNNSSGGQVKLFQYTTNCNLILQSNRLLFGEVDCDCNPGFYWIAGDCRPLDCNLMEYAAGQGIMPNTCICQPGYAWQNQCVRICTEVPNSLGMNSGKDCLCQNGFYWNGLTCLANLTGRAGQTTTTTTQGSTTTTQGGTQTLTAGIAPGTTSSTTSTTTGGTTTTTTVTSNTIETNPTTTSTTVVNPSPITSTVTRTTTTRVISEQPEVNCKAIPNSTGNNIDPNNCECQPGFTWNRFSCVSSTTTSTTTTGGVVRTTTSQRQVITTTQIDCKNVLFSTGNNGPGACFCQPNYFWRDVGCFRNCTTVQFSTGANNGLNQCFCQMGYRWDGTNCVYSTQIEIKATTLFNDSRCRQINGAVGTNGVGGCICQAGLTWISNMCLFNCSQIINATPGFYANACPCNNGTTWNQVTRTCESLRIRVVDVITNDAPNCKIIPKAVGQLPNSCTCESGYFWSNGICARDCTKVPESEGFGANGTCRCKSAFYYNDGLCVRVINCKDLPNAITASPSDPFSCVCSNGFIWRNGQCIRNCSVIPNNFNAQNNGADACLCVKDYTWQNGTCVSNLLPGGCSSVLYALGNDVIPNTCKCAPEFIWILNGCYRNCSAFNFTTGRNINFTDCECQQGRVWNRNTCILSVKCSDLPNTKKGSTAERNIDACQCEPGYVWSQRQVNCIRNCPNVTMSTGRNRDLNTCECMTGYSWASSGQCLLGIDCTPLKFAKSKDINNPRGCICNDGFFWDAPKERCAQDCLKLQNSNGATSQGLCRCKDLFVYNSTNNLCESICMTMEFSKKEIESDGRCVCIDKYQWSNSESKCVPKPGSKAGLILGLALGIPLGLLGLLALGALSWYLCCKPQTTGMIPVPSGVPRPNNMALGSLIADHPDTVKMKGVANGMANGMGNGMANGVVYDNGVNSLARRQVTQYLSPPMVGPPPMIATGPSIISAPPAQYMNQQRIIGAPAFATGGVATQLVDAASLGDLDLGQIGSGVALGQTSSGTALLAGPGLPITTKIMDGMRTTSTAPKYTVVDTQTGNQAFLNYPFGAADDQ